MKQELAGDSQLPYYNYKIRLKAGGHLALPTPCFLLQSSEQWAAGLLASLSLSLLKQLSCSSACPGSLSTRDNVELLTLLPLPPEC